LAWPGSKGLEEEKKYSLLQGVTLEEHSFGPVYPLRGMKKLFFLSGGKKRRESFLGKGGGWLGPTIFRKGEIDTPRHRVVTGVVVN